MASLAHPTSPRAARARSRLALAVAVLVPVLAGCSRGFDAQTDQIYQPGPGISVRHDGVYALNAAIVTDGAGHGTLIGALLNQEDRPDALSAVRVVGPDGKPLSVTILPGTVTLPPHRSVQLAYTGDVRVTGTLTSGSNYRIVLTFRNGQPISVLVPVLSRRDEFATVPVGPVASPLNGGPGATFEHPLP